MPMNKHFAYIEIPMRVQMHDTSKSAYSFLEQGIVLILNVVPITIWL